MGITQQLILKLILVLAVAWVFGSIFARFGLPVILGQMIAGFILGPAVFNIIQNSNSLQLMAEFGIFFAMFYAGMEMDPKELLDYIWPSLLVGVGGFILPFILGYFVVRVLGGTSYQSLFVGLGLSITAIAVQATVLQEMRILKSEIGHIIIGAAIVSDILALVVLSILLGLAKKGSIGISSLVLIVSKVIAFFGLTILLGHFLVPKITPKLNDREAKGFTFALLAAFVMSALAELAGLHLIIGAFLAGLFVRKETLDRKIFEKIRDRFFGLSHGFLLPIFFVSLAFHLHVKLSTPFIVLSASVTLVAILGKLIGSGIGSYFSGQNLVQSVTVGLGMNGRGAVELAIAAVVLEVSGELMKTNVISAPLLTNDQFASLILMAFITTLIAPLSLKWFVVKSCETEEKDHFCKLVDSTKYM